jgi:hypothetical protein
MAGLLGVAGVLRTSPMFGRPPCVLLGRLVMTLGRARIAYAFGPLGGATFNLRHAVVHRGRALMGPCEALNGLRSAPAAIRGRCSGFSERYEYCVARNARA